MANFPASLDTLTNPTPTDYLNSPSHAGQHATANNILESLEAKVGIDSSAVTTSHDYKLSEVNGTDKAVGKTATQTLENKTITSPIIKTWDGWQAVSDSWSYASADSPTFVITVPSGAASLYSPGMRIKLTQTTVKYFIITAVADTVLTVYGGTDYILTSATISEISYSTQKAPFGFPLDPAKWTVITQSTDGFAQTLPTKDVWYNAKSLVVPIGAWALGYITTTYGASAVSKISIRVVCTLSTANNSESDTGMSQTAGVSGASGALVAVGPSGLIEKSINISSKTTYYLNVKTTIDTANVSEVGIAGSVGTTIRAVCAYL